MSYSNATMPDLEASRKALIEKIEYYSEQAAKFEAEKDQIKSLEKEITELSEQKNAAKEKLEKAKDLLAAVEQQKEEAEKAVAVLIAKQVDLALDNQKDEEIKLGAVQTINEQRQMQRTLQDQSAKLILELDTLERRKLESTKELNGLKKQNEELAKVITAFQEEITQLESNKSVLMVEIKESETLKDAKLKLAEGVARDLEAKEQELIQAKAAVSVEVKKVTDLHESITREKIEWEKTYNEQSGELSLKEAALNAKESQLKDFKTELEKVHGKPIKISL